MTISTEAIKSALSALIDPVTGTDYVSGKMFKSAETDENGNVKVFIDSNVRYSNRYLLVNLCL